MHEDRALARDLVDQDHRHLVRDAARGTRRVRDVDALVGERAPRELAERTVAEGADVARAAAPALQRDERGRDLSARLTVVAGERLLACRRSGTSSTVQRWSTAFTPTPTRRRPRPRGRAMPIAVTCSEPAAPDRGPTTGIVRIGVAAGGAEQRMRRQRRRHRRRRAAPGGTGGPARRAELAGKPGRIVDGVIASGSSPSADHA